MASRTYKRDNAGKFAGSGSATKTTIGRAGGFASPGVRQKAAAGKLRKARSANRKRIAKGLAGSVATGLVAATAARIVIR